jgi:hypothetical protein
MHLYLRFLYFTKCKYNFPLLLFLYYYFIKFLLLVFYYSDTVNQNHIEYKSEKLRVDTYNPCIEIWK